MTLMVRTLEGAPIEAGFFSMDVGRVRLGELPPISTPQFVGYAALTLIEGIFPHLDADTRTKWSREADDLYDSVRDVPNKTQEPLQLVKDAITYPVSPFVVLDPRGERVGFMHESNIYHTTNREEFYTFAYHIIRGGFMGWGMQGIYPEAKMAACAIQEGFR